MNTFDFFILVAFFVPVAVHCRVRDLGGFRGNFGGSCPYQRPSVTCQSEVFPTKHEPECYEDEDCGAHLKCCEMGCDMKCRAPVHYQRLCNAPVDLGILFDNQEDVWADVKGMLNKVIHKMSVSSDRTHVSLRAIGENKTLLKFDQLTGSKLDTTNVWDVIKSHQPLRHSGKLSTALELAKDMFSAENGGRAGALKVLLLFTNANIDLEADPKEVARVEAAAQALKDSGILVQSVGISMELDLFNLVAIATKDVYVWPGVDAEMLVGLKKLEKEPCDF